MIERLLDLSLYVDQLSDRSFTCQLSLIGQLIIHVSILYSITCYLYFDFVFFY